MWRATTDDEANLIFDLVKVRDAEWPVLEYANWLEDRGELQAAEFLRLVLSPVDLERLKYLRQELDERWLRTVTSRWFQKGDIVRITAGPCAGIEATIVEVDAIAGKTALWLLLFCFPRLLWVDFSDMQLLRCACSP
jgi:uncharacterized protein (TIGR02996 family)